MQIAAATPQCVSKEDIPRDVLERNATFSASVRVTRANPRRWLDKIVEGRMSKFYEEVCLLEQPFIRENTISVGDLIRTAAAKLGDSIKVARFVRYKVGDAGMRPAWKRVRCQ